MIPVGPYIVIAAPTCKVLCGFVVPIPKFPVEGIKTKAVEPVVAIPTELTPALDAKIGYTGVDVNG